MQSRSVLLISNSFGVAKGLCLNSNLAGMAGGNIAKKYCAFACQKYASIATILVKMNGTFRPPLPPPPPPHFNDAKMAGFGLRAPSSLLLGGRGLIVPFYSVQDCRCNTKNQVL